MVAYSIKENLPVANVVGDDNAGDVAGTSGGNATLVRIGSSINIAPSTAISSSSTAISASGSVIGNFNDASNNEHAFLYNRNSGTSSSIDTALSASSSYAKSISSQGTNVAGKFYFSGSPYLYLYTTSSGVAHSVGIQGGQLDPNGFTGVNDSGEIVGSAIDTSNQSVGFIYNNTGGQAYLFSINGATSTMPITVNDSGVVIGLYTLPGIPGNGNSFIRDAQGNTTILSGPTNAEPNNTYVNAINNSGQVSGVYLDTAGVEHAFVYDIATQHYSTIDIPNSSLVYDAKIDDYGNVLGNAADASFKSFSYEAAVVPVVTITSPATNGPDHVATTISGNVAFAGGAAAVSLTENGQVLATAPLDSGGNFSTSVVLPNLGPNNIVAGVVTNAGVAATSAPVVDTTFQTLADIDPTSQQVDRLYYSILQRAADPTALSLDDSALNHHHTTLNKIAKSLIASKEDRNLYGHQTNSAFVDALFSAALGRAADPGSLAVDVHQLAHGLSRQALAVGIAEGPEASSHLSIRSP